MLGSGEAADKPPSACVTCVPSGAENLCSGGCNSLWLSFQRSSTSITTYLSVLIRAVPQELNEPHVAFPIP